MRKTASLPQAPDKNGCQKTKNQKKKEEEKTEKTEKLQLGGFIENGFYGTQEQQYLKAQVREELKE